MLHQNPIQKSIVALAALALAALPLIANAGEVDNRINHEQARIDQGVWSGQLTRGEFDNVETRLDRINGARRSDLRANGGRLTAQEQQHLNARESYLSESIYFDKHNLARQPGAPRY